MKIFLTAALIGLVAMSCSKSESSDSGIPNPGDGLMTFAAVTQGTRAYFPGADGQMYWDEYDHIGAYSFASDGVLCQSDFCTIAAGSKGTDDGTFTPSTHTLRSAWVDGSKTGDYTFYAYYPQLTAPHAACSAGCVALNIPSSQSGVFGKHQICVSEAVTMSYQAILDEDPIEFMFSPVSSMLRVRLVLTSDSEVDEVTINQLTASVEGAALTGDCRLTLADGSLVPTAAATGKNSVTANLSTPVKITKIAANNPYIDLVVLPGKPTGTISFQAYIGSTKLTMSLKNVPSGGFKPGLRYNLDRNITVLTQGGGSGEGGTVEIPDGSYVDGGDAWEHTVDNDSAYTDGGFAW